MADMPLFRTTKDDEISALKKRIAELERIMQHTHIHSRKHTPGYCTVRQSDIDRIGDAIDPHRNDVREQ